MHPWYSLVPNYFHSIFGRNQTKQSFKAIQFKWPGDCPLEVRELVGPENFDSSSPNYTMPFFWRTDAVLATRSW
uniref:Uncharacterized protein n=1 Tax=Meloidogyne incognita TaxID=6306 RepID=A0A914KNB7_MELIC